MKKHHVFFPPALSVGSNVCVNSYEKTVRCVCLSVCEHKGAFDRSVTLNARLRSFQ